MWSLTRSQNSSHECLGELSVLHVYIVVNRRWGFMITFNNATPWLRDAYGKRLSYLGNEACISFVGMI
jgi:hypothetical protein